MPLIDVELHIDWTIYLARYRTPAAQVFATATDGRRVRFPANILQRFVENDGVHGQFRIRCDEQGRLLGIERVSRVFGADYHYRGFMR